MTVGWAIFPGLAVAFIKARVAQFRPGDDMAMAALSVAEGYSSLLSVLVLGGWQSTHPGGSVLFLAAAGTATAAPLFLFTI